MPDTIFCIYSQISKKFDYSRNEIHNYDLIIFSITTPESNKGDLFTTDVKSASVTDKVVQTDDIKNRL